MYDYMDFDEFLTFMTYYDVRGMPSGPGGKRLRLYGGGNGVTVVDLYVLIWVWLVDKAVYCTTSGWRQFVRE